MIGWNESLEIIESRELDRFKRSAEQIETYRKAKERFTESHGGVAQFVKQERLHWDGPRADPVGQTFLGDMRDVKILPNDFSYDFAPDITHVVVWSRVRCPCTADQFPTLEARDAIEAYLEREFVNKYKMDRKDIAWFKNTVALQSIPSLEHFHVLIRNVPPELSDLLKTL